MGAVITTTLSNTGTLGASDDSYSGAITLPFTATIGTTTTSTIWVHNNGSVALGDTHPSNSEFGYQNFSTANGPLLGPGLADVDTTGPLTTEYVNWGEGTYDGHTAFYVNWPHVGYYYHGEDLLNHFQLILVDVGGGNLDIIYNYDQIQWEVGDTGGLASTSGDNDTIRMGLNDGAGHHYEFPGNNTPGALLDGGPNSPVVSSRNSAQLGRYIFHVTAGSIDVAPLPAPIVRNWTLVGSTQLYNGSDDADPNNASGNPAGTATRGLLGVTVFENKVGSLYRSKLRAFSTGGSGAPALGATFTRDTGTYYYTFGVSPGFWHSFSAQIQFIADTVFVVLWERSASPYPQLCLSTYKINSDLSISQVGSDQILTTTIFTDCSVDGPGAVGIRTITGYDGYLAMSYSVGSGIAGAYRIVAVSPTTGAVTFNAPAATSSFWYLGVNPAEVYPGIFLQSLVGGGLGVVKFDVASMTITQGTTASTYSYNTTGFGGDIAITTDFDGHAYIPAKDVATYGFWLLKVSVNKTTLAITVGTAKELSHDFRAAGGELTWTPADYIVPGYGAIGALTMGSGGFLGDGAGGINAFTMWRTSTGSSLSAYGQSGDDSVGFSRADLTGDAYYLSGNSTLYYNVQRGNTPNDVVVVVTTWPTGGTGATPGTGSQPAGRIEVLHYSVVDPPTTPAPSTRLWDWQFLGEAAPYTGVGAPDPNNANGEPHGLITRGNLGILQFNHLAGPSTGANWAEDLVAFDHSGDAPALGVPLRKDLGSFFGGTAIWQTDAPRITFVSDSIFVVVWYKSGNLGQLGTYKINTDLSITELATYDLSAVLTDCTTFRSTGIEPHGVTGHDGALLLTYLTDLTVPGTSAYRICSINLGTGAVTFGSPIATTYDPYYGNFSSEVAPGVFVFQNSATAMAVRVDVGAGSVTEGPILTGMDLANRSIQCYSALDYSLYVPYFTSGPGVAKLDVDSTTLAITLTTDVFVPADLSAIGYVQWYGGTDSGAIMPNATGGFNMLAAWRNSAGDNQYYGLSGDTTTGNDWFDLGTRRWYLAGNGYNIYNAAPSTTQDTVLTLVQTGTAVYPGTATYPDGQLRLAKFRVVAMPPSTPAPPPIDTSSPPGSTLDESDTLATPPARIIEGQLWP